MRACVCTCLAISYSLYLSRRCETFSVKHSLGFRPDSARQITGLLCREGAGLLTAPPVPCCAKTIWPNFQQNFADPVSGLFKICGGTINPLSFSL